MDITSGKNKMAFDCYCIDFQNKKRIENIEIIKQNFPYIKIIPFVKSYYDMAQMIVESSRTEYIWMLSSLINYSNFDFDYIPEQFQKLQLHTWKVPNQKEGQGTKND